MALAWNFLLEVDEHRCFYPASRRWMDPMCPLPKKGTSCRDTHGLIVTMCCSHKLHNFAPHMKETSFFLGYTDRSCFFAVWGRGWCNFSFALFSFVFLSSLFSCFLALSSDLFLFSFLSFVCLLFPECVAKGSRY